MENTEMSETDMMNALTDLERRVETIREMTMKIFKHFNSVLPKQVNVMESTERRLKQLEEDNALLMQFLRKIPGFNKQAESIKSIPSSEEYDDPYSPHGTVPSENGSFFPERDYKGSNATGSSRGSYPSEFDV